MKSIITILTLVTFASFNPLHKEKEKTIIVHYGAISCSCAQWIINLDAITQEDREYIYLEPANEKIQDADKLWDGETLPLVLRLTGNFRQKNGFPKGFTPAKGNPSPARVFRYTALTILKHK